MSFRDDDLSMRRRELSARIERQRQELGAAYQNLTTPIKYTEHAMRGFGFLRQNPWVFSVLPAAFTITSAIVGIVRAPKVDKVKAGASFWGKEARRAEKAPKSVLGHGIKWAGHGFKLFRLYSKFRKFL